MAVAVAAFGPRLLTVGLVCVALCGCDAPWRHDMHDQPSPSAAAGPRSPADGSLPIEAQGPFDRSAGETIVNPLTASDRSVATGRLLYNTYCGPCHGGTVEKYFPKMPSLAEPELQRHGDGWWYATITNGIGLMPPTGHELDPAERWQIVQYVRTLADR